MKKYLLLTCLAIALSSSSVNDDVYICNSKGAKRYHLTKECKGLSNCKAEVKKVTMDYAKNEGKTLYGYED